MGSGRESVTRIIGTELRHTLKAHDRFLIIDNSTLYHIGASLKDLGKKCFAFEVLDSVWIKEILKNL